MGAVFESFSPPSINRAEIYRYLRSRYDEDIDALIDSVIEEATELTYLVSYVITDVAFDEEKIFLGNIKVESEDLRRCLNGCNNLYSPIDNQCYCIACYLVGRMI